MSAPDRPCVIVQDTREPAEEAGDHPDSVFRPCIFPAGIPRGTPIADRPRERLPTIRRKLNVGDWSLPGLEHVVALERKSGPDLLATLFGEGMTASGERAAHGDRFRAELERARGLALFAIVCEASEGWLFTEARRRFETYGKAFDPFAVLGILRSFAVDLGVPTLWCGSKVLAELEVGSTLARVWSQATGGSKARDMRKRGYGAAWLGMLEHAAPEELAEDAEPQHGAGVVASGDHDKRHAAHTEGADGVTPVPASAAEERTAARVSEAGGMPWSTREAMDRRAQKRRTA